MRVINIHEAKTHFSKLISAALSGEDIIIAKSGKRLVKLTPYDDELPPRRGGQLKGMISISDDFDAPLPKDIEDSFYND